MQADRRSAAHRAHRKPGAPAGSMLPVRVGSGLPAKPPGYPWGPGSGRLDLGRKASGRGDQVEIDRQEIVDQLRGRDEDDVADRAEQELPEQVDTDEHADLLHRLGINPTDLLGGIGGTFG